MDLYIFFTFIYFKSCRIKSVVIINCHAFIFARYKYTRDDFLFFLKSENHLSLVFTPCNYQLNHQTSTSVCVSFTLSSPTVQLVVPPLFIILPFSPSASSPSSLYLYHRPICALLLSCRQLGRHQSRRRESFSKEGQKGNLLKTSTK